MRLLAVVAALTMAPDAPADLVPQVLAGLLGLVAAALAMRQLARARRTPPPGRHTGPGPPPPDRDPPGGRRR
jgi:hypothetical protein